MGHRRTLSRAAHVRDRDERPCPSHLVAHMVTGRSSLRAAHRSGRARTPRGKHMLMRSHFGHVSSWAPDGALTPPSKGLRVLVISLVSALLCLMCAASVLIQTSPAQAAVSYKLPFAGQWNVVQGHHTNLNGSGHAWDFQPPG